jgi:exopolysaccharide production protein ExoZ
MSLNRQPKNDEEFVVNPAIEFFRGIAAWMVLTSHYALFFTSSPNVLNFLWTGVDFFFVISGFVFGKVIYSNQIDLRAYAIRRGLRIYPLYLLSLLFYFVFTAAHPDKLLFFIKHLFLLHTTHSTQEAFFFNPAYWSLPVEVEFYCVVPGLAFWFTRTKNALYWTFWLCLFVTLWIAAHATPLNQPNFYTIVHFHLPAILLEFWVGIYVYQQYLKYQYQSVSIVFLTTIFSLGIILLSILAFCFVVQRGDIDNHLFSKAYFNFLAAVGYGCVLFPFLLRPLSGFGIGALMGNISYGVYLFHHLVPKLFNALGANFTGITAYCLYSTVVVAMALLFHYGLERPARTFGRNFSKQFKR